MINTRVQVSLPSCTVSFLQGACLESLCLCSSKVGAAQSSSSHRQCLNSLAQQEHQTVFGLGIGLAWLVVTSAATVQVWAGSICAGPDEVKIAATYEHSHKVEFQDSVGASIAAIAGIVPDGLLVFLPSYVMLDRLMERWKVWLPPQAQLWHSLQHLTRTDSRLPNVYTVFGEMFSFSDRISFLHSSVAPNRLRSQSLLQA